ncbi:mechanosensitive ion channel protein [Aurantiacibacter xanthus]|uniref:Mechanosensitive ion channel protein n=2 Tax=Aurantiacibacter xanthus TaxID=1784712 RepID=A0A3A1P8B5_9SPHN|nr:mechanosensitive ion channel domain-containing protein [Aurantiacibacter xanthus]RIV87316.1 mechanosensitive ion channel protein [Aurantiacibacter xanthus]
MSGANMPSDFPVNDDGVAGADALKDAVAEQSVTIAGAIEKLDSWGFTIADTRFSVWSVLVVIMVVAGVIIGARLFSRVSHSMLERLTKLDPSQRLLAEKMLTIVVWAAAILIGIDMLGINLTALTVFSGAFGLAIGFGLQKTFGNLIAGIILLLDKSIKPGDVIAIADQSGKESFGQIRKIGIRAVSIVTRDEKEYLIPNENLMVNQVENWSYSSKNVRMQVRVGISYGADMKLAEKLMLEAAADCPRVLKVPPPTVWMNEYGDNSVNFVIHCWIVDPEEGVGNVRSMVLKRLWDLFEEHDIEIPFPQRDLNLRDNAQFQQLVAAIAQRVEKKNDPV